ncbi:MAG TPA: carboxypeptidase regulatory-like domain-containing protein [Thermoanaerobaculia bacterium]|nr:carboxypeptidase regulatory-like domain-containing protein [Thermoanaerobaculia bacterium]
MSRRRVGAAAVAAVAAGLLAVGAGGAAQARQPETGNVDGKVTDEQQQALPGVEVTLSTGDTRAVQVTDGKGEFRFSALPPATMALRAELVGFYATECPQVPVTAGRVTHLEITMRSDLIDDFFTPLFSTLLLDPRQLTRGATLGDELRDVLAARDPWTIAAAVPGVLAGRTSAANTAGSGSGVQAILAGPGATSANSVWAMDGVILTDMAVPGAPPADFDVEAIGEIQVATGGGDVANPTGGAFVNLVTKRGYNHWSGDGHFFDTPGGAAASSSPARRQLAPGEPPPAALHGSSAVRDGGADAGGPIVAEHAWIWGAYDDRQARAVALGGGASEARLPIWNAKGNAQLGVANTLTLFAMQDRTTVAGGDAGPQRTQPTTWDEERRGAGPTVARAEYTQVFTPTLFLTGLLSAVRGGFDLTPAGGAGPLPYLDGDGVWHNSYLAVGTRRPQRQAKLDGSTFVQLGAVTNQLGAGAAYRSADTDATTSWGDGLVVAGAGGVPGANLFAADREASYAVRNTYTSGYAQDIIEFNQLTASAGLRYDVQRGHDLPSTVAANPVFPGLLPSYQVAGGPSGLRWANLAPRAGLAYPLGPYDRQVLLRASYARYADQLGAGFAAIRDPAAMHSYYDFSTPQTGPGLPSVLLPNGPPASRFSGNLDPRSGLPLPLNAVDPRFSAPRTDELLASVEHVLRPEMAVGLELTWRRLSNLVAADAGATTNPNGALAGGGIPLVFDDPNPFAPATLGSVGRPATRADFVPRTSAVRLPDGRVVEVTYDVLAPGISTRGGTWLTNSGQSSDYAGAALTFRQRLLKTWTVRGSFTWSDWTYGRGGGGGQVPDPTDFLPGGNRGGDAVLTGGGGPGAPPFALLNARWSGYLDGLVEVAANHPWGFDLAGDLTARQGYPLPLYVRVPLDLPNYSAGLSEDVLVGRPDAVRLPAVVQLDARIAKQLSFGDFGLTLSIDCFNLLDAATVTQRVAQLGLGTSDYVDAVLNPRIYRFGARIDFH